MKNSFLHSYFSWGLVVFCTFLLTFLAVFSLLQVRKTRKIIQRSSPFFQKKYSKASPLAKIPYAEEKNMILGIKRICIKNVPFPYNGSIEESSSGNYLIVFRFDAFKPLSHLSEINYGPKSKRPPSFYTYLGMAEFDPFFNQTSTDTHILDTQSHFSEDPRLFKMNHEYYVIYNDLVPLKTNYRSIRIGKIDLEHHRLSYSTDLDLYINPIEKNWSPFILQTGENSTLALSYQFNPHKVMFLKNPAVKNLEHLNYDSPPMIDQLAWSDRWGPIHGGTPARLVDGEYLAFFHSSFIDFETHKRWFTLGAYTFESSFPFRVTRISKNPILFHGIYSTPHQHTSPTNSNVIFPGGFVIQRQGDKDVVQLLCGENDCTLKLISLDKKKLLQSLAKIKYSNPANR